MCEVSTCCNQYMCEVSTCCNQFMCEVSTCCNQYMCTCRYEGSVICGRSVFYGSSSMSSSSNSNEDPFSNQRDDAQTPTGTREPFISTASFRGFNFLDL